MSHYFGGDFKKLHIIHTSCTMNPPTTLKIFKNFQRPPLYQRPTEIAFYSSNKKGEKILNSTQSLVKIIKL